MIIIMLYLHFLTFLVLPRARHRGVPKMAPVETAAAICHDMKFAGSYMPRLSILIHLFIQSSLIVSVSAI
jgi:hypothetical protein